MSQEQKYFRSNANPTMTAKKPPEAATAERDIDAISPMKWAHLDSNQGQPGYEPGALTAELWALQDLPHIIAESCQLDKQSSQIR